MVKRLLKFAGKASRKAKNVLFADPKILFDQERHLKNEPFFFLPDRQAGEGTNGKGVLLVHGWTSTPYELRRLGKYLNENGYTVLGIRLTGHGTKPEDLEGVKWQQWLQDVDQSYQKLKKSCDKVYIGGTSIGAVLAVMFTKDNPDVAGLVLMATPYRIRFEMVVSSFAKLLLLLGIKYRKKFYPPTFGAATTITRVISYQIYPIASVAQTFAVIREARKNYAKITQPCLVMQSTHDHIVYKKSLEMIYKKISSKTKKKKYIEKAYHTFISDIKNEHVFEDIKRFLDSN